MSKIVCQNCGSIGASGDLFCQECGSKFSKPIPSVYHNPKSRLHEYRGYVKVIGVIEIVFGVFALFITGILVLVAALMPMLLSDETRPDLFDGMTHIPAGSMDHSYGIALFVMIVLGFVALFILAFAILSIVNGKRLMNYQRNGHSGSILISVLSLLAMPFGTIFGIFSLYVLTRPEVDQILS